MVRSCCSLTGTSLPSHRLGSFVSSRSHTTLSPRSSSLRFVQQFVATTSSSTAMTSRLSELTPHAEVLSKEQARAVNVAAAVGLERVLASNLGPRGTLKLLVGGAGQLRLTKDGLVLLKEMQIQHPTANMIARTATAQDDITGDGTTTTVLLCGELLAQADRYAREGLHPRVLVDGLEQARDAAVKFLQEFAVQPTTMAAVAGAAPEQGDATAATAAAATTLAAYKAILQNRDLLHHVASTSLHTKLDPDLAEQLTVAIVDAMQCISRMDDNDTHEQQTAAEERDRITPIDLHRVEIMSMPRKSGMDSRFVNGIVLDHGGRHPDMPKVLRNCHVMVANVSLEYERTEVSAGFFYSNAEEREKLVESERKWLDERCQQIVNLKRSVCKENESFVLINQKGVDPLSLDMFAKEGILCLRRAKRRNMERLTLACGGSPILSLDDLDPKSLGYCGKVTEVTLGDDKFTFVEDCAHAKSCTLLLQGPNATTLDQMKDAVRDGLRAVKNCIEDGGAVVPGAGAFELAASMYLQKTVMPTIPGRAKLGVEAFAQALLIIPKTLAENAGLDIQDAMLKLQEERQATGLAVGLNIVTGDPMLPADEGIWDNVRVKRQCLYLSTVLASQLLLVDEVMRAGKQMGRQPDGTDPMEL